MGINNKIQDYIEVKGIKSVEIAKRMGISKQNLSRILNSDDLKVSQLIEISRHLDVPPTYFFDGVEVIGNEELERLRAENKRINDYSNLVTEHIKVLIDKHFDSKIRILESEFPNENQSLMEQLIKEAESEREEEKLFYSNWNTSVIDLVKNEFPIDQEKIIEQCRSEIRKARRTKEETEALKTRAINIKNKK